MPSSRARWGRILFPVLFSLASVSEGSAQPARTEGWVFGLGSGTTAVASSRHSGTGLHLDAKSARLSVGVSWWP